MWPVSDRFLKALGYGQRRKIVCTVTPPGGDEVELTVLGGNLRCDGTQRVRRRIDLFSVLGDSSTFELAATPGALFRVFAGLSFRSSEELVPIFAGEAQNPRQTFGGGSIGLTLLDPGQWLSRCRFVSPYVVNAGTDRITAITAAVQFARPGTEVVDLSGYSGELQAQQVWTENALDVLDDLTKDVGLEGFFRADGAFVIRTVPTTLTLPAWSIRSGRGGTLTSLDRVRPTDRLYNTVVAQPSALDGSQTWADQVAQITDTADALHPSKVGVVPLFLPLPTANTAAAALHAAQTRLDRVRGRTESLSFGSISNPALEAGDVVRVTTHRVNSDKPRTWQHYVDGFDFDLASGVMTGQTRAQVLDG